MWNNITISFSSCKVAPEPDPLQKRTNVRKQSSMNEELMSFSRLEEKERLRQNITKQTSLGEDVAYKNTTFEALKESIYSRYNASKSLQLLTSGLTNRIKQSTSSGIERAVSGSSFRNGFVRILQSWKSTDSEKKPDESQLSPSYLLGAERRLSREDGSDSSKDSSLQSDTSVDSEDSFASVIFVPKQPQQQEDPLSTLSSLPQTANIASAPPSPRLKFAADGQVRAKGGKVVPVSPLIKQFPATSKSLPPSSPPGLILSPKTLSSAPLRPFFFDYKRPGASSEDPRAPAPTFFQQMSPLAKKEEVNEASVETVLLIAK